MPRITADLFTVAEAAEALGLSASARRCAIKYGTLTPIRLDGRTNVIPRDEVERYRRNHLRKPGRKASRRRD